MKLGSNAFDLSEEEEEKEMSKSQTLKYSRQAKCYVCEKPLDLKFDSDGICKTPNCTRNETLRTAHTLGIQKY